MSVEWTEEIWRGSVESAPDALVMISENGGIVFVNSQTETLFGYKSEELLGQTIEILLPERYRGKHVSQRNDYFSKPRVRPMGAGLELFGRHKDGREIPIEISLSPLKTASGSVVTAAIRDISDRKRAQEELRKAREVAEAASRSKSEFLANMSHEIRTPLAGILGYAEMIAFYCNSSEERKSYMDKIRRCADTLTELINDILDLSKVEAGALRVEAMNFNVAAEIETVVGMLQPVATDKKLVLDVKYQRPLPSQVTSDPTRFRQILTNLVGNALKFTDHGSVVVEVFVDPQSPSFICFSVTDTGCGLTEPQQARLFQPFVQADSSTTRKYGGTGLGLALSRRLAEAMGGELHLMKSVLNQGSTFQLRIPVQIEGGKNNHFLKTDLQDSQVEMPRLDGLRILVVEDNTDNQDLLRRFLREQGAAVDIACNGEEAVKSVSGKTYEVILMDIQMPVLDGYEATKRIRHSGVNTPIIALTAHAMSDEKERCLASGCNAFLSKPFNVPKIVQTVYKFAKTGG